MSLEGTVTVLY